MNLATATQLLAGEWSIERESNNIPEMPQHQVKAAMPTSIGQKESGWQYGFRHPVGYIPQRTLSGFPSGAKMPRRGGASVHSVKPKAPKMPRRPNPSMGHSHSAPKAGHFHTSPSIKTPKHSTGTGRSFTPHLPSAITRPLATTKHGSVGHSFKPHFPKLASGSEVQEPPTGAYSKDNTHEQGYWFDEPKKGKVTAVGTSEGAEKGWDSRGRGRQNIDPMYVHDYSKDRHEMDPEDRKRMIEQTIRELKHRHPVMERIDPRILKGIPLSPGRSPFDPGRLAEAKQRQQFLEDSAEEGAFKNRVFSDADGEPYGTMQHIHIDPKPTFSPPSLVKRKKQTRVPTDEPGETDNKYLDVTKRDSKDTQEFRMKMLRRAAPGGAPAQIPARTTLIPEHSGVYLPTSMMSAQKRPWKQRPVNWNKQPKQRVSFARRGCI